MFLNLFGEYLVNKGKMTDAQFEELKATQAKTRVKLGLIAVAEKMMTEQQADEVNRKQAVMDKRFGDIAVELSYLTNEQVSKLLDLQGNAYMLFSQTVTDMGVMTLPEVEEQMAAFAEEMNFSEDEVTAFKADEIDKIVPAYLGEADELSAELIKVAIRTLNRLITTDLSIAKAYKQNGYKCDNAAYQCLEGDYNVKSAFTGKDNSVLEIANAFAGEEFECVDLDALDSVGEFINIVNGLYATNLSYNKVRVELMPPVFCETPTEIPDDGLTIVPLKVNGKDVDLIVKVEECKDK